MRHERAGLVLTPHEWRAASERQALEDLVCACMLMPFEYVIPPSPTSVGVLWVHLNVHRLPIEPN